MAKAVRKGRRDVPRRTTLMRLPRLAAPVARDVSHEPWSAGMKASRLGCAACFSACGKLPGHLKSMCESVCRTVCPG